LHKSISRLTSKQIPAKPLPKFADSPPNTRTSHMPKFLLIKDEAAVQRFMDGVREAGLLE